MLTPTQISDFQEKLAQSKKIAICTHYNPDGDAIGSSLALQSFFSTQGFEVTCVIPNNMPEFYAWMPGAKTILNAHQQFKEVKRILLEADILFMVDMSAEHRSGVDIENILLQSPAYKILIDHHINPAAKCDIIYSITDISSTCEIIPRFLAEITDKPFLTKELGICIYTGIITDTGSLSFACNHAETYTLLAKLMELGVDGEEIHRKVYDNYSESRIRLLGLTLSTLKVFPQLGTSYMYLTREEMKKHHFKDGDNEGFVNYGISLKGIFFTTLLIERENRIRLSFRSKKGFDVNQFAKTYFNGGGHPNAAAAYHYDTLENTIKYLEEVIHKHPELNAMH